MDARDPGKLVDATIQETLADAMIQEKLMDATIQKTLAGATTQLDALIQDKYRLMLRSQVQRNVVADTFTP